MKKIILRFTPYFSAILAGLGIYYIALVCDGKLSDLLINISATFLAIPLLVLFYDLIKSRSDKKLNAEIDDYVKQLVDKQVLSAINQISKVIYPLEERDFSLKGISRIIQLSEIDILNEIDTNKYLGFQVFKHWKIADKSINELLSNSLIANKMENDKIISIIEILKSIKTLEYVLKNNALYIETEEEIDGYKIDRGFPDPDNPLPDRYMLLRYIENDKYQVCDFGDIKKYNIDKCLKCYIVNNEYKKSLCHSIYCLLNSLDKWIKISGNEVIIDQDMFRIRNA